MTFKTAAFATLAALAALPAVVRAEDAPAAPSTAFNIGAVTEYRYRGISQTRLQPALQGGADYTNPNGIYLGTWISTIKWVKDAGGKADVEWDLYGGYKGEITKELSYDVGGLYYWYPDNKLPTNADTFEIYGALTYGMFTAKYSHSTTNLFGFTDSKNSGYFDLSAAVDLGNGWSLTPHLGYQKVSKNGDFSYTDYSATVGKDLGNGISLTAALVGASTKSIAGVKAYASPANGKDLGKGTIVLGAKFTF